MPAAADSGPAICASRCGYLTRSCSRRRPQAVWLSTSPSAPRPNSGALGGDKHSPKGASVTSITERVRRFPRCRACRLPGGVDRRLIAGPGVYICESCIALARRGSSGDTAERCSFCGRRDVPIAGDWPSLAICAPCVDLSHSILARTIGDHDPPPNES
jgi:hypothetical protein